MGSKIFREKSIERVSSPEQLDDYLKVPNVSIWVILVTLLIMATSVIVWANAGNIITKIDTTGSFVIKNSKNLSVSAVVPVDEAKNVKLNNPCKIYDRYSGAGECLLGHVINVSKDVSLFSGANYPKDWVSNKITENGECVLVNIELEPGDAGNSYKWQDNKKAKNTDFMKHGNLCKVEIVTETIKPISFLF